MTYFAGQYQHLYPGWVPKRREVAMRRAAKVELCWDDSHKTSLGGWYVKASGTSATTLGIVSDESEDILAPGCSYFPRHVDPETADAIIRMSLKWGGWVATDGVIREAVSNRE